MIAIMLVLGLVTLYIVSTLLNQSTNVPEECQDITIDKCTSCHHQGCSLKEHT
ncbi:MAG: hypothetical protein ACVCEJ_03505 [Candidatus Izemoplasmataceae bacterium]